MNDRKYGHRGYQESSRTGGGGRPSDAPPRFEGAPKGRGAERNRDEVFRCKACGEKNDVEVARAATCKKCGAALHACSQCRHFDSSAPNQCRKPVAAAIPSKNAANDCALFEPAVSLDLKGRTAIDTPDQARAAFDKLFGKK